MSNRVRLLLAGAAGSALLFVGLLFYYHWAIQQVEPYYSAALSIDRIRLQDASLKLESRLTTLVSDAVENPSWQAVFSEEEINGWLAITLPEKFPSLLPSSVTDPRVKISDQAATLGFQYQEDDFQTCISVQIALKVIDSDTLAIHLLKAQAGKLPIPLAQIVDKISEQSIQQQIALHWTQQDGKPVALIPINSLLSGKHVDRTLQMVELHRGELFLAGSSKQQAIAKRKLDSPK